MSIESVKKPASNRGWPTVRNMNPSKNFLFILIGGILILFQTGQKAHARELKAQKTYRWFEKKNKEKRLPFLLKKFGLLKNSFDILHFISTHNIQLPYFKNKNNEMKLKKENQFVGSAKIRNSWMHTIIENGQIVFSKGKVFKNPPNHLLHTINSLERQKNTFKVNQMKVSQELYQAAKVFDPRIELVFDPNKKIFQARWLIEYLKSDYSAIWRLEFDTEGNKISNTKISTAFTEGQAIVFPQGPKFSELERVKLPSMIGDGSLKNHQFKIISALGQSAHSYNHIFEYETNNKHFDEVQSYYFVERALDWFKQQLNIELDNFLDVKVHVGGNKASNAAFYFNNKIFLGKGDGKMYENIPQDPSIVIHEVSHAIIDQYSSLGNKGASGAFNEAYADFYTAMLLDNPYIGETSYKLGNYKRSLHNDLKAFIDFKDAKYHNSQIISATFWDIQELIGKEKALRLAFHTMLLLDQDISFADFAPIVQNVATDRLTKQDLQSVNFVLQERNWISQYK